MSFDIQVSIFDKSTKTSAIRKSDINFDKLLYRSLTNKGAYNQTQQFINTPVIATTKLDGTQVRFIVNKNTISQIRTHNGYLIGSDKKYTINNKLPLKFIYQEGNLGKFLNDNFDKYIMLFHKLNSLYVKISYITIFMEFIIPTSPCGIIYDDKYIHKGYVFEIILNTGQSIRIDKKTKIFLDSIGILSVPIKFEGKFNKEFIDNVCDKLINTKKNICEGYIMYLPEFNKGFKIKYGLYHESSFCHKINKQMHTDNIYGKMISSVITMLNKTHVPKQNCNANKTRVSKQKCVFNEQIVLNLIYKELGHDKWIEQFNKLDKKEYKMFFDKFKDVILKKIMDLNPNSIDKKTTKLINRIMDQNIYKIFNTIK
jgi:hypothetical protein